MKKPTILVAPLNWGLGHATRCIPIINQLINYQVDVIIASDGAALTLLRRIFPDLPSIELGSYGVSYQRGGSFVLNMMRQYPTILKAIRAEHKQLIHYATTLNIDAVISDNRFGLWHPSIPTVFITHQLFTSLKGGWRLMAPILHWFNHSKIKKFGEVWVPDTADSRNLSGVLSHRHVPGLQVHFIGWLSHFSSFKPASNPKQQFDIAVILSGPEPQRSILEQTLLPQLEKLPKRSILVRGLPETTSSIRTQKIEVINYMTASELHQTISSSEVIVCRSGYTSLMDLAYLRKKAILIPTPGQAEQEYLANHFDQRRFCPKAEQRTLNIASELSKLADYDGIPVPDESSALKQRIEALINRAAQ